MMKLTYVNVNECMGMLERHNPLLLRDEAGGYLLFETWGRMYVWVLERMLSLFPRGYVDLRLLMHELTGLDMEACDQVVRLSLLGTARRGFVMLHWQESDTERYRSLELVMTLLHKVTQTRLDHTWFVQAVDTFDDVHGFE